MAKPYHLTIIGSRFPQLALGTLLAKGGKRVLIVDSLAAGSGSGDKVETGFRYRKRPVPMSGLDTGGFLRKLLSEIGIGHVLVNEAYPKNKVSYQVVLPRHRLNVYPERERLLAEVSREFPASMERIRELYEEWDGIASRWYIGSNSFKDLERSWLSPALVKHRFKELLSSLKASNRAKTFDLSTPEFDFFAIQHLFIGAIRVPAVVPSLSGALIHSLGRRGTYQETTGTSGLADLMLKRFQEYGGEFQHGVKVNSVEMTAKDRLDVELSDGQRVNTKTLSTTAEIAAVIKGLLETFPGKSPKEKAPVHPVRFYLGIEENMVPAGMEDNVYFMREDEGGPLGMKSCYLALSPSGSELAPEACRSITVTSLLSPEVLRRVDRTALKAVREDLLQALEAVIPFLSEGLREFSTDLEHESGNQVPRMLPPGNVGWTPGIMGRRAVTARMRRRVAVISPTPWELGTEGEALAAVAAAGIIKKVLGSES